MEYSYYIFYDILNKKKHAKTINNKIERMLLNNIYNMEGGNKYGVIFEKIYSVKDIIKPLTDAYEQMKKFQLKLDELLISLRPIKISSEELNQKIKLIIDTRNKYDNIINNLNKVIQTYFYNFKQNIDLDIETDINLFIKSEKAKWENIIEIYKNFINNYKSIVETIKGNNLTEIIKIVNKNLDENIIELNKLVNLLILTKEKLENVQEKFNSIIDAKYNKSDIKLTNKMQNIVDISQNFLYLNSVKFNNVQQLIKPGNIKLLQSIIEGLISELNIITIDLNLDLPEIENRVIKLQSGGNPIEKLNNTIEKLNEFGIQLQNVNLLMNNVRELNDNYIQLKIRMNYYILYIMMIERDINKSHLTYYKFINKLILEYYNKILTEINRNIITKQGDKYIEYFDKYHYITIKRLIKFCNFLISEIGDNDVISVDECTGKIFNTFIIFNNFKYILDDYIKIKK